MITLVEYNPSWPAMYEEEEARIRALFGAQAVLVEHVGSTSVPGLTAKAVIDIQVSVPSLKPIADGRTHESREGYSRGKTEFVERVLRMAEAAR